MLFNLPTNGSVLMRFSLYLCFSVGAFQPTDQDPKHPAFASAFAIASNANSRFLDSESQIPEERGIKSADSDNDNQKAIKKSQE